jgi:hypothetical protein
MATEIDHWMNGKDSPLEGKINLSGASGLGKPLQLNSWVSSLGPLFNFEQFEILELADKYAIIKAYWVALRHLYERDFTDHKNSLLLSSVGVYALNLLLADICEWHSANVATVKDAVSRYLEPLKDFNWSKNGPNPTPIKGLGGSSGVTAAYRILLEWLAKGGIEEASRKLGKLNGLDTGIQKEIAK